MTHEQFCYWLQGFLEMSGPGVAMTPQQVQMVREHLDMCFVKITSSPGFGGASGMTYDRSTGAVTFC